MKFNVLGVDNNSSARAGVLELSHGRVETPVFMPVGTQGTVKALSPQDLIDCQAQIILGNTYHLYLRPGVEIIKDAGGIQKFSSWNRPILTDSGGYQVFSLAELNKINEQGIRFQSHLDGSYHFFTPELVIKLQRALGSDIAMVLDECVPYPCDIDYARQSTELTIQWAQRSLDAWESNPAEFDFEQNLFSIIQGSTYDELRRTCTTRLMEMDFPGYAIGGLSVGEPKTALYEITEVCTSLLPREKPRYLMGVGKPEDLIKCVALGIDMFDCVMPTRNGRNGTVYTPHGPIVVKNALYKDDFKPIDDDCPCYTCQNFSRAYLRHLFQAEELLVLRLASIHNLTFYLNLMKEMREAILKGNFTSWCNNFFSFYRTDETMKD